MNCEGPIDTKLDDKDQIKSIHFDTMFFINSACELLRTNNEFSKIYSPYISVSKFINQRNDKRDIANDFFKNIHRYEETHFISLMAFGEIYHTLQKELRDDNDKNIYPAICEAWTILNRDLLMKYNFNLYYPPYTTYKDLYCLHCHFTNKFDIKYSDAFILAYAVSDKSCSYFLSTDKDFKETTNPDYTKLITYVDKFRQKREMGKLWIMEGL